MLRWCVEPLFWKNKRSIVAAISTSVACPNWVTQRVKYEWKESNPDV